MSRHQFKTSQDRVIGPDILYAVGLDHVRHHLATTRPHSMTKKRLRQIQSGRPNVCYIFEKQEGFICPTNIAFIWITFLNQYVANFQKHHPYCLGKISFKNHNINVGAPQSSKQNILFARPWQRQMMWTWLGQWVASSKTNNQPFPIWKLKAI